MHKSTMKTLVRYVDPEVIVQARCMKMKILLAAGDLNRAGAGECTVQENGDAWVPLSLWLAVEAAAR